MSISAETRLRVRQRANFACEYCGVSEAQVGGELTIDHFCPLSKAGTDDFENLIYCCHRCNHYKGDYWPKEPEDRHLWNPRQEPASIHFHHLYDGTILHLTEIGEFTLWRLNLNRDGLVQHRLLLRKTAEESRQLKGYQELFGMVPRFLEYLLAVTEENQHLKKTVLVLMEKLSAYQGKDDRH